MPLHHAIFAISVLGIVWSIYRLHRNPLVDFNFLDLLMENDRVSKVSCLVMGSFFVTSWLVVDLQAHGRLTEGYFGLYIGAWIAPLITKLWPAATVAPATTTTATATVATVSTEAHSPSNKRVSAKSKQ